MRHYETIFIINPEISDEETDAVVEKYSSLLTEGGAFMGMVDKWGRRRLAYNVRKFNKGFYVLFDYGSSPEAVAEMERNFKIDDNVIRFLTVKQGENYDIEAAKAALEAKAAKQAQAEEEAAQRAEAKEAEAKEEAAQEEAPAEAEAPAETEVPAEAQAVAEEQGGDDADEPQEKKE
jgi:small subunit ribosomal protein S6